MIIYFLIENFDVFLSVLRTRGHISTWRHLSGCGPRAADTDPNMYKNIWRHFQKRKKSLPKGIPLITMQYFPFHSSFATMENGRKKTTKLDRKIDQMDQIPTSSTSASRSVSHAVKTSISPLVRQHRTCRLHHQAGHQPGSGSGSGSGSTSVSDGPVTRQ